MRTFEQFRNNSLFSSHKSGRSHFPDADMSLSDLLQLRRRHTSPCYVIAEVEEPNDKVYDNISCQKTVSSSKADHLVLPGRNLNNINEQECVAQQKVDTCLACVSKSFTSSASECANPNNRTGHRNCSSPLNIGTAGTSERLAACRGKLSLLSKPIKTEISSSSSSSSSLSSSPCTSDRDDESSCDEPQFQHQQPALVNNRNHSEVKSGHLVLIATDQNSPSALSPTSKCAPRAVSPCRYPVLVKIHKKSYERYAIINRTRRHPTMPSFYLKLKNSRVMTSSTNPCYFVVIVDGSEGRTFHFEASNPELAKEWIQAFSTDNFCHRKSPLNHKPVLLTADSSDTQTDLKQAHRLQIPSPDSSFSSPQPKILRSPLMPVLSETPDELDECEEQ